MKKESGKKKYLAGHQRSWVWGRHAVAEILEAAKWPMRELYLADDIQETHIEALQQQARALGAAVAIVSRDRLRRLCGVSGHQGVLARMGPYPYMTLEGMLEHSTRMPSPPLWLVLDALRDPNNFGALVRSAAALDATAVIVSDTEQTPVNNHVARASAGAVNRIPIVQTDSLPKALACLREAGTRCAAADPRGVLPAWRYDFTQATALVLGNESNGIHTELLDLCDARVVVPGSGSLDSLNVAAAGAALLYEALRQRSAFPSK